jgi:hypothetical protein
VFDELMPSALDGSLPLDEILSDYFVRDLRTRMFGPVWKWVGRWRRLELNTGVAAEQIAVELRSTLDTIAYRWEHTDDWTPRQLGIVMRAETVLIHPLADGNWRTIRFLADLVFAAVQNPPSCSTTGSLTRRGTSSCFGPTTDTETWPILRLSLVWSRSSPKPLRDPRIRVCAPRRSLDPRRQREIQDAWEPDQRRSRAT